MTTSTPSGNRGSRHAKPSPWWRIPAMMGALVVLVGFIATVVVANFGHGAASRNDPLGKAVAGIISSRPARIASQDAALARNCTEPIAKLPRHGTLAMVYPGQLIAGLVGSDQVKSYSPTKTGGSKGYTTYTWTLNPQQQIVADYYAVRTAPGQCSTALPMKIRHGGAFSLGNGKTKRFLLLEARTLRGTSLAWVEIIAITKPAK